MFRITIMKHSLKHLVKNTILILGLSLGLVSCVDENIVFEENKSFDGKSWERKKAISFEFDIQDTTSFYLTSCHLKNLNDYAYSNLFLNYSIEDSLGNKLKQNVKDLLLYNPKTGEPLGDVESFSDAQIGVYQLDTLKFHQLGKHKINIQHHMRDLNSIDQILSIGVQITKLAPK